MKLVRLKPEEDKNNAILYRIYRLTVDHIIENYSKNY
jgi:hypothetical protein